MVAETLGIHSDVDQSGDLPEPDGRTRGMYHRKHFKAGAWRGHHSKNPKTLLRRVTWLTRVQSPDFPGEKCVRIQFQFLTPQERKLHASLEGTLRCLWNRTKATSMGPFKLAHDWWDSDCRRSTPASLQGPGAVAASSLGEGSIGCFTSCAENDCSLRSRLRTNGLNHESTLQ